MANPTKVKAKVASIERFDEGTYRVRFQPQGSVPRYKPGQFLHLTLDEYDPTGGFWPESRVFSIASAPGDAQLEVIYSVKGRYTRRMEEALKLGVQVWLKLPYGNFIIESALASNQDAVLVAGGTGLSPFLPYLQQVISRGERKRSVRLYYGVRENSLILAGELLEKCAESNLVDVRLFVENYGPASSILPGVVVANGRLPIEQIHSQSQDLIAPVFFLSGPPTMISFFKDRLRAANIEPERIIVDEWE